MTKKHILKVKNYHYFQTSRKGSVKIRFYTYTYLVFYKNILRRSEEWKWRVYPKTDNSLNINKHYLVHPVLSVTEIRGARHFGFHVRCCGIQAFPTEEAVPHLLPFCKTYSQIDSVSLHPTSCSCSAGVTWKRNFYANAYSKARSYWTLTKTSALVV